MYLPVKTSKTERFAKYNGPLSLLYELLFSVIRINDFNIFINEILLAFFCYHAYNLRVIADQ